MQKSIYKEQKNKSAQNGKNTQFFGGGGTYMNIFSNKKKGIIYSLGMGLLLILVIASIISYMYNHSEKEAFEKLRLETLRQKESISLQITSDRETLSSMAMLIGANYNDTSGYMEVCKSFKPFGLCHDIGILVPGDILITKHGAIDVSGKLSYEEEKTKGTYISGCETDVTNPEITNIRSVVPIADYDGNTKAILFGTISAQDFSDYYKDQLSMGSAYLCLLESQSGEFIIDTKDVVSHKNITNLASVAYKDKYSYKEFSEDIINGAQGYTSFVANDSEEYLYICYDKLGIEDWRIMLAQPESVVLASVNTTVSFLVFSSALICLIILIYVLGIGWSNRKKAKLNLVASEIRKSLLEINQRSESLTDALRKLVEYAKSRSAFVSDSYAEECHYMLPEQIENKLKPDEIKYFNDKLLYYTSRNRTKHGVSLHGSKLYADRKTKKEMPDFYDFLVSHRIDSVIYDVIINNNSTMYVLGVLNPKNKEVDELLDKVAACFSMAVYNRKHLERTHQMALTDSLTGTKNRTAFSRDKKTHHYQDTDFACIYIDVNELNYYNNKFGHAAGDQMLKFIGGVLRNIFFDSDIYRMGGDEFLILNASADKDEIGARIEQATHDIEEMKYHIAVGVKFSTVGTSLEDAVNAAEKDMYGNKALYYQDKELHKVKNIKDKNVNLIETGVKEIDACLSVMTVRYIGIYFVSLDKDSCVRIMAPTYFNSLNEEAYVFSATMKKYINEFVKPGYHRAFLNFLEYDVLKKHFEEGHIPEIYYERIDGEKVRLKIYCINKDENTSDCIWVFEKEDY